MRFCEICHEAIISNAQAGRHLCYAAKYKTSICRQHHLKLLYKIPFGQVKEGRQLAVARLFTCSICEDLLAKPKTCGNCRVNFCSSCIADHLQESNRCPKCYIEKPSIIDFPQKLRQELGRIKLICRARSVTTQDSETGELYG